MAPKRILLLSNPRSGSTLLANYLKSHPNIFLAHELLNDEEDISPEEFENPLDYVEQQLQSLEEAHPSASVIGFKVFPEQIYKRNLSFDQLVFHLGITHVIILWRNSLLETYVSKLIATETGNWYSTEEATKLHSVAVQSADFHQFKKDVLEEWILIGRQWPVQVQPIFIEYESFKNNKTIECDRILEFLSCTQIGGKLFAYCKRQNPWPLADKITNWKEIQGDESILLKEQLDVQSILEPLLEANLKIPADLLQYVPDREPPPPTTGWSYRVAEPYMSKGIKLNVYEAIESGIVSSAGGWVGRLSSKLKSLFGVPVAQPCSNGFTAIVLALQAGGVGPGDEVIIPSLTMIAVANAVSYVGATVVFADSTPDNYNPDWAQFVKVSTPKTKAIIVTHTYGVPTPGILEIAKQCKQRGWWLIEDISECVGIEIFANADQEEKKAPRLLGTFGDFACASLYANKIVHAGDGGFIIAKNPCFNEKLKSLANHGFTPSYHFVHFEVSMNCKINGVGAAMALGCLNELEFIMKHRTELSSMYRQLLDKTPLKCMPSCGWKDTPWVFGVECSSKEERTKLRRFLAKFGIETRDYFFPIHLQPAYNQGQQQQYQLRCQNAERFGSTGFYLPTYSNLKAEDVTYICAVIGKFYENRRTGENGCLLNGENEQLVFKPPSKPLVQALFIEPDSFNIGVKILNPSTGQFQPDEQVGVKYIYGHPLKKAVKLMLELEEGLALESWEKQQLLLGDIQTLIQSVEHLKIGQAAAAGIREKLLTQFQLYIDYFHSQSKYEELTYKFKPWATENLNDALYEASFNIPTTTDQETLKLLLWLVKSRKCQVIWEIGCWFGHTTVRFAEAATTSLVSDTHPINIYACDVFKWQKWMKRYQPKTETNVNEGDSFLPQFKEYIAPYKNIIHPVIWPYSITGLPTILNDASSPLPELIFIDMTQEVEDLEFIWSLIKPKCVSRKTVVVFNGFVGKSLPFFTRHAAEFAPIAKPSTIAKAFLYIDPSEVQNAGIPMADPPSPPQSLVLERKLRFHSSPPWYHHHQNAFNSPIELLRAELHSPTASTLFIPAVEETLCDEPELFLNSPWIGIIHSIQSHPEFFYTPDLSRLCSAEFAPAFRTCKGLFTLTAFQADYLRKNLGKVLGYNLPIQSLTYPMILDQNKVPSPSSTTTVLELWKQSQPINFLLVGSFARDFDLFYNCAIPGNLVKTVLVGDETIEAEVRIRAKPNDGVQILPRLNDEDYEGVLRSSIIFLPLIYDGAANTTILECIARSIPIVIPSFLSCLEYVGADYPLIYNHMEKSPNFAELITMERVQAAVDYLRVMDKSRFDPQRLIETVKSSAVLLAVSPEDPPPPPSFDLTISICSYKRTHHLAKILDSLWNGQDFQGTFQIIIWNNNIERSELVHEICRSFRLQSNMRKSLEIIDSTTNYYCSIRLALAPLMKSSALLICDDDIIPSPTFISFFMSAHSKYPSNLLCTRGHIFLPHEMDLSNATNVWGNYEHLRFKSDETPEQFIHFVHADTCLIPKSALLEAVSVQMPDPSFSLVDDYWLSFILNSRFGRQLRKLSTGELKELPFVRTDDSDTVGLALHTRTEVKDAKLRLYIHHKLQNWPPVPEVEDEQGANGIWMDEKFIELKKSFWKSSNKRPFVGYNVSSTLSKDDLKKLLELNVNVVRIGAVGIGGCNGQNGFPKEFGQLNDNPEVAVNQLVKTIQKLGQHGIYVVVTCSKEYSSALNWTMIAKKCRAFGNVIGYDLINEPSLKSEIGMHRIELENVQPNGIPIEMKCYIGLIEAIRTVDHATPIILEPSFWGHLDALRLLPIQTFLKQDTNLVVSFHFYEPRLITQRSKNKGRFQFPDTVPIYDGIKWSSTIQWDCQEIKTQLSRAVKWGADNGIPIFLGEFGICRDVVGSSQYLKAILDSCAEIGLSSFIYSFRDKYWDAMNYEFGTAPHNYFITDEEKQNDLMKVVISGIQKENCC